MKLSKLFVIVLLAGTLGVFGCGNDPDTGNGGSGGTAGSGGSAGSGGTAGSGGSAGSGGTAGGGGTAGSGGTAGTGGAGGASEFCINNGNCSDDDCVCADCVGDLGCNAGCDNDEVCNAFRENCLCADCNTHPECLN